MEQPAQSDRKAPSAAETTADPFIGRSLGEFVILGPVGAGGMGHVYLAEQVSLRRRVALKILKPELVGDSSYLRRFQAEARSVAPIHHPNICSVIAIGSQDGIHYIAMEYVQGMNLREYVARHGALEIAASVRVLRQVAAALVRAAEEGLVHRDIKPDNILLTKKGEVKVADFGLARQCNDGELRLTQTGVTMGTPLFMSPEQIHGHSVDGRSDIYSLGAVAYYMLAGRPPFVGESAMAVAMQHCGSPPPPLSEARPEVPPSLVQIIEKMLAKKPEDRFESAAALLAALDAANLEPSSGSSSFAIRDSVSSATPLPRMATTTASFPPKRRNPRRWFAWIGIAAIFIVAGTAGMALEGWRSGWSVLRLGDNSSTTLPPDISGIEEFRTGALQLMYANLATNELERERRLWAVLLYHPGDEQEVTAVAIELARVYLDRRDYPMAMVLADDLVPRDDEQLQMLGYALQGIVLARLGEAERSNLSFVKMHEHSRRLEVEPAQLLWLAEQYALALRQNNPSQVPAATTDLLKKFRQVFVPRPARTLRARLAQ